MQPLKVAAGWQGWARCAGHARAATGGTSGVNDPFACAGGHCLAETPAQREGMAPCHMANASAGARAWPGRQLPAHWQSGTDCFAIGKNQWWLAVAWDQERARVTAPLRGPAAN